MYGAWGELGTFVFKTRYRSLHTYKLYKYAKKKKREEGVRLEEEVQKKEIGAHKT